MTFEESKLKPETLKRVKTGGIERRFSMAKAGLIAGLRFAAQSTGHLFLPKEQRAAKQKESLSKEAIYLVHELGKLKGSVVKIGQMMALWGEHYLPPEVTAALHSLEDQTAALDWSVMYPVLLRELGKEKLNELEIDSVPIGTGSLGQVHVATRKKDRKKICLKIQYPGVADAIDTDLDSVATILRMTRLVPFNEDFHGWLEEVRTMLKRETNYPLELETTRRFREHLSRNERLIVPEVFPEYSSTQIVATSFEEGVSVDDTAVLALSQERRNRIAEASIQLCWQEVFELGEMQTDPNFGNFLVKIDHSGQNQDRLVLIVFGAVKQFDAHTLKYGIELAKGSFYHDSASIKNAVIELSFLPASASDKLFEAFSEVCFLAIEPFTNPQEHSVPEELLTDAKEYKWAESQLTTRIIKKAASAALSRHFKIPPKEFMFLSRKIMGAYTLLSVLKAEICGFKVMQRFLT